MSTFGKNIFTQFKVWINPIDCSKEACPPPCSLVQECDEFDTETDHRAWDTVTCIPDAGSSVDDDFTLLPANYTMPVKSYIPWARGADPEWSGDRAVILGSSERIQTWSHDNTFVDCKFGMSDKVVCEHMVTLSDGMKMKRIDFCKSVYESGMNWMDSEDYHKI